MTTLYPVTTIDATDYVLMYVVYSTSDDGHGMAINHRAFQTKEQAERFVSRTKTPGWQSGITAVGMPVHSIRHP